MRFYEGKVELPADAVATTVMEMTVDHQEMMVRLMEAYLRRPRPTGMTARQALEGADAETRATLNRMAMAACDYFAECLSSARPGDAGPLQ